MGGGWDGAYVYAAIRAPGGACLALVPGRTDLAGMRERSGPLYPLEQGRASYQCGAWDEAYRSLSLADQTNPLETEDLELLATSWHEPVPQPSLRQEPS
jgi:hypothetical protein